MIESKHFKEMLIERNISTDLVDVTIAKPDVIEDKPDGTRHYLKRLESYNNHWLRVIVNICKRPPIKVTAFFDRRLRRMKK